MSNIEQLIKEFCPEGVEFKKLWEVTAWDKKFNGLDKHMQKKVIIYPYVLANKFKELELEKGNVRLLSTGNYIGWTTEVLAGKNLCEGEIVAIPWGGKANVKYCKGKFVTADNRIATSLDTNLLLNKFLFYWMLINIELIESFYRGAGIKHPRMKSVLTMEIPIPPLPIQKEIVNILDKFAQLEAELEAELEARKKQYQYYRNELLNFEGKEVEWKTLGEVCKITSGGTPSTKEKLFWENGTVPWLKSEVCKDCYLSSAETFITESGLNNSSAKYLEKGTVLMAMVGATIFKAAFLNFQATTNQNIAGIKSIDTRKLSDKFIFYYILYSYSFLTSKLSGYNMINLSQIKNIQIPIPPLSEQERIVAILDKFDALVNDITVGLPAEIQARRKQYEFYRGKLLDFKNVING